MGLVGGPPGGKGRTLLRMEAAEGAGPAGARVDAPALGRPQASVERGQRRSCAGRSRLRLA
jgi:hypothetical protein